MQARKTLVASLGKVGGELYDHANGLDTESGKERLRTERGKIGGQWSNI